MDTFDRYFSDLINKLVCLNLICFLFDLQKRNVMQYLTTPYLFSKQVDLPLLITTWNYSTQTVSMNDTQEIQIYLGYMAYSGVLANLKRNFFHSVNAL